MLVLMDSIKKRNDIWLNVDRNLSIDTVWEGFIDTLLSEAPEGDILRVSPKTIYDAIKNIDFDHIAYTKMVADKLRMVVETFLEQPKGNFTARYSRVSCEFIVNIDTEFIRRLEAVYTSSERYQMVLKHSLYIIRDIRSNYWEYADSENKRRVYLRDIRTCLLNIRNFRLAYMGGNPNDIFVRLFSVDIVPNNAMTVVRNIKKSAKVVNEEMYKYITTWQSIPEMVHMMLQPETNSLYETKKAKYEAIEDDEIREKALKTLKANTVIVGYSTNNGLRPEVSMGDYENWNGFQAFDLDIKNDQAAVGRIEEIRETLHDRLCQYHWYIGIKKSLSGRGLHILTKATPIHCFTDNTKVYHDTQEILFKVNYWQKFSVIRYILKEICGLDASKLGKVIDKAMMHIGQGLVINYDPNILFNNTFVDLPVYVGFSKPPIVDAALDAWLFNEESMAALFADPNMSVSDVTKNSKVKIKEEKTRLQSSVFRPTLSPQADTVFRHTEVTLPVNITTYASDIDRMPKGVKDVVRAKICRTAVYIHQHLLDKSENVQRLNDCLRILLGVGSSFSYGEFIGKMNYAMTHPMYDDNIKDIMVRHGFIIQQKADIKKNEEDEPILDFSNVEGVDESVEDYQSEGTPSAAPSTMLDKAARELADSVVEHHTFDPDNIFDIKGGYLSDIKDTLIDSFDGSKINILESPPGSGKTELMKSLSMRFRILLVAPYTSVLKNKVELVKEYDDIFDVCYGSKKIDLMVRDEHGRLKSIATTPDKFANLKTEDYKAFNIIVVDESHLLFTSEYREHVMSKVIRNIKYYINECRVRGFQDFTIGESVLTDFSGLDRSFYASNPEETRIVMMTGTVTGELLYYIDTYNITNYIKIKTTGRIKKNVDMLLCETEDHRNLTLIEVVAEAMRRGRKVIMPTNGGDLHIENIVDKVNLLLRRSRDEEVGRGEYVYYKKSNTESTASKTINEQSRLPQNIKILFCSAYLGVGVDINNTDMDFLVVFNGDLFTAQDIEQFNNRIRKRDIHSVLVYTALKKNVDKRKKAELAALLKRQTEDIAAMRCDCGDMTNREIAVMMGFDYYLSVCDRGEDTKEESFTVLPSLISADSTYIHPSMEDNEDAIFDDRLRGYVSRGISTKYDRALRKEIPEYLAMESRYHYTENNKVMFNEDKWKLHAFTRKFESVAKRPAYVRYALAENYGYTLRIRPVPVRDDSQSYITLFKDIDSDNRLGFTMEKTKAFVYIFEFFRSNPKYIKGNVKYEYIADADQDIFRYETHVEEYLNEQTNEFIYDIKIIHTQYFTKIVEKAVKYARRLLVLYSPDTAMKVIERRLKSFQYVRADGSVSMEIELAIGNDRTDAEIDKDMKLITLVSRSMNNALPVTVADTQRIIEGFCIEEDGRDGGCVRLNTNGDGETTLSFSEQTAPLLKSRLALYAERFITELGGHSTYFRTEEAQMQTFEKTMDAIKLYLEGFVENKNCECTFRKVYRFDSEAYTEHYHREKMLMEYLCGGIDITKREELMVERETAEQFLSDGSLSDQDALFIDDTIATGELKAKRKRTKKQKVIEI